MALTIKRQIAASAKHWDGTNPCQGITVHQTGNTKVGANAQMHANLQSTGNVRDASWHYQVDDHEAIQSFEDTTRCWHAGDGHGLGNYTSIGVEICVNSDGDYVQAVTNAAELVRTLMARHNIPAAHVVQHNYWTGKDCPDQLRDGKDGITWSDFLVLGAKPRVFGSRTQTEGMVGSDIQEGQVRLNVLRPRFAPGLAPLEEDGQFGPLTAEMWRAFQTWAGLKPDASVGPLTVAAFVAAEALPAPEPDPLPDPEPEPEPIPTPEPEPKKKPWWIPPLATGTTYTGAFKYMMTKTIEITLPTFEGLAKSIAAWAQGLYVSSIRTIMPGVVAVVLAAITPALNWLGIQPNEETLITVGVTALAGLWYVVARTFENQKKYPWLAKIGGYMLGIPKTPTYVTPVPVV